MAGYPLKNWPSVIGRAKQSCQKGEIGILKQKRERLPYWYCTMSNFGKSLDKLLHPKSDAYSAQLVLLNKQQILYGGAYLDCYRNFCWNSFSVGTARLTDMHGYGLGYSLPDN